MHRSHFVLLSLLFWSLSFIPAYAQDAMNADFAAAWARVDSLENQGLPQSARAVVDSIFAEATGAQRVKALIYRSKYTTFLEENAPQQVVADVRAAIEAASDPVEQAVLRSVLAELYWRYYQQNRWRIHERTAAPVPDADDLETWDLKTIIAEAMALFLQSVEPDRALQQTPIDRYRAILTGNAAGEVLRPTLYDVLVHRALDFLTNPEASLTTPDKRFALDDSAYFAPAPVFVELRLQDDTPEANALRLLQDLLAFHLAQSDPNAFLDADLRRLMLVHDHASVPGRDALYIEALEDLRQQHADEPHAAQITFTLAQFYNQQAGQYEPGGDETHRWDRRTAHQICQDAVAQHPGTMGAQNCRALLSQITQKELSFQAAQAVAPDVPILVRVDYRNSAPLHVKAVAVTRQEWQTFEQLRYDQRPQRLRAFAARPTVASVSHTLPDDGDYQPHATEIAVPPLASGVYLLLASTSPDFAFGEGEALAHTLVQATPLGYFSRQRPDGAFDVYVVDRQTSHPIARATVIQRYTERRGLVGGTIRRVQTDRDGYARLETADRPFSITLSHEGDSLYAAEDFYGYRYQPDHRREFATYFFTDRAIYRPGQTVYFKGILMAVEDDKAEIVPGMETRVRFHDANYQEVAALDLVANEFGTFSGRFTAPEGGLNGQMTIANDYGSVGFSVEDYKRPRFEVILNPPDDAPALGDTVTVAGTAQAYAGANIDGAEVTYRVVRTPRWLPWFYWRGFHGGEPVEIVQGTTRTSADGTFAVRFPAVPDPTLEPNEGLMFTFRVEADVTDVTGETHSAETYVTVGYRTLMLSLTMPQQIDKTTFEQATLSATNLNGKPQPTIGRFAAVRLDPPDRYFRAELWPTPDRQVLSREAFVEAFPHDDFADEDEMRMWPVAETIITLPFDTATQQAIDLSQIDEWPSGAYRFELHAQDAQGRDVKFERYVTVYSPDDHRLPFPMPAWFVPASTSGQPGSEAIFLIGTSAHDTRVRFEIEHDGAISQSRWIELSNEQQRITVPIEEQHRGGFRVHFAMARDNRAYTVTHAVTVPLTPDEQPLTVALATFRDKLKPGSDEEWTITVKGAGGDAVAAELVSTMYDASLDAFRPHNWYFGLPTTYKPALSSLNGQTFWQTAISSLEAPGWNVGYDFTGLAYPRLNWFGFDYFGPGRRMFQRGVAAMAAPAPSVREEAAEMAMEDRAAESDAVTVTSQKVANGSGEGLDDAAEESTAVLPALVTERLALVQARRNLSETAFWFPHLRTDADGAVVLSFTMPEALTRWKMLAFALTKDLRTGQLQQEVVTQKELMVTPNAPRFFREGDTLRFTAKVANLSDTTLAGYARLMLFDATTMEPLDAELGNTDALRRFQIAEDRSQGMAWTLTVPDGLEAVTYRVVADAGSFSDGEENVVPVVTNRALVTETLPLPVNGNETKHFTFDKLLEHDSPTLRDYRFTLEFTPNPVWYAMQALPYLMEYPYECAEQIFSRFYANSIATHIVHQNPRIEEVYERWRAEDSDALVSNLEKNQELKSLLLDATPWVMQAQDETARKRRIAELFDMPKMQAELAAALRQLDQMQYPNGAWPWFMGGPEDRYITQHVAAGLGHLQHLRVLDPTAEDRVASLLTRALGYLDEEIREDYERLIERKADLKANHLGPLQVHYLYTRSFFPNQPLTDRQREAHEFYRTQAQQHWLKQNTYLQGMIALALHRTGDSATPPKIVASLREFALHDDEIGMYWKRDAGYFWWQAPVETQALLIEVFSEVAHDEDAVEDMKQWLLKQKQTQDWHTTKATAAAVYALLLRGTDLTSEEAEVVVRLGDIVIDTGEFSNAEAGTGYVKMAWDGTLITPSMGDISVTKQGDGIAWGAVYWQYFEDLDKITPHETPMELSKQVFLQKNTPTGPELIALGNGATLTPGDLLKVRIILRTDRNLEYVHMKDMRASGLEPVNVLSQYQWQDGLGYYESTRDAATHFFFGVLPQGTFVFEYPLRVAHAGDFSNGITTIQAMYAPEFSAHSEGTRLHVEAPPETASEVAGSE